MSTKKTDKKPASKKSALDKGAAEIRRLAAKAPKKPAAKKTDDPKKGDQIVLPPEPVKESNEKIEFLLKKHVVFAEDSTSLRVKDDTELGEFLPIYDFVRTEAANAKDKADKWQFVEGDLFNEGKRLYGKEFSVLMAKNGRPVSTLKKLGSISANIDTALRNLHPKLDWSHVAEVAKVPSEAKKLEILEGAAKKLDAGEKVSVKDIRALATKATPPKPPRTKPPVPKYELSGEEQSLVDAFKEEIAGGVQFAQEEKKRLKALLPKLTGNDKKAVAESLELLSELYLLIA